MTELAAAPVAEKALVKLTDILELAVVALHVTGDPENVQELILAIEFDAKISAGRVM